MGWGTGLGVVRRTATGILQQPEVANKCDAWKCDTFSRKQIWPKNHFGTVCVGRNTEQVNVFTGWQTFLERCWTFYFDWRNFLIAIVCQSEAEEWIFGIRKILKIIPHRPLLGILQPCLRILLPSSLLLSNNVNTFTSANIILLLVVCPRRLECYSQCLDLTAFPPFSLVLDIIHHNLDFSSIATL